MSLDSLRGIWVPLVTPFADGRVDHTALAALVRSFAASGIRGLVACGSTGEAATLSHDEQQAVLKTVLDNAGDLPVLMGAGGTEQVSTAAACEAVRHWAGQPIAGFLVAPPAYIRPSQAGLLAHFEAVAEASALPVVLYDVPSRTGVRIETPTMLTLAGHPRIVGVKDCSGDLDHLQAIVSDGRLQVLCGDDARIFASVCLGAVGAVAASAHVHADRFAELIRRVEANEWAAARALWQRLWPLTMAMFAEPNPAPVKAALAMRGLVRDELRAPMARAGDATRKQLAQALEGLEGLEPT